MDLKIRGEKLEITNAMKEYASNKINKLSKYLEQEEQVQSNILFKKQGVNQKVEITIPLKKYTLRVEETGEDFYATIDTAIDKLERQIIKNKTRINSKKQKEKSDFNLDYDFSNFNVEEDENKIIKRKKVELKPMDEEEAILQMELLGHDFYLFKDIDTNKFAVIYKRKNKDYGLIEEE